MDKLQSEQDKLCRWLSDDPDYILKECGDILSLNDFLEAQRQSSPSDKMRVLLKIIIKKGEDTCCSFLDILRQHQAHYQHLHQFFTSEGSSTPAMAADISSIITAREITNTKGKSLSLRTETVSGPGSGSSGHVEQVGQAVYIARGGSVICADKLTDVTIDGDIDLSVTVRTSQVHAGPVHARASSSQGPAVKKITEHKVELIDCLRADSFILQHAHTKRIVTDRQYQNMKHVTSPEETVISLIDQVIANGEESCSLFADVLKDPDVLQTYPQLKHIIMPWC